MNNIISKLESRVSLIYMMTGLISPLSLSLSVCPGDSHGNGIKEPKSSRLSDSSSSSEESGDESSSSGTGSSTSSSSDDEKGHSTTQL